tara:strand:- start:155 stop:817 length:663 start_codon:yes stop_codon:yes gene_type:complete
MNNATTLGNLRDSGTLEDMARNLKKWGSLTSRQAEFAKVLIERNTDEKVQEAAKAQEAHHRGWEGSEEYREWIVFLARFFSGSKQTAYIHHIQNRLVAANCILASHIGQTTPLWGYCERLLTSKLAPRLRAIFENPPIYSAGELVQIRASEVSYYDRSKGVDKEMGFILEVEPSYVDTVATYNKAKGGTKTYRIMFTSSGEVTLRENQIKRVSRKNHNKE